MRLRLADFRRLRRPVDAVMFLRQVDPHDAHGIVRARRDLRLRMLRGGIPEQLRVVVEYRVLRDSLDLPRTQRERIVFAAYRGGKVRKGLSRGVDERNGG